MFFQKMHFGWVRFNIEISKVTGPNFTGLVSPNAGRIAVDRIKVRFSKSSSVSEIFVAELRSRPKSGQILHVFCPRNFFGVHPPKFWTGIIKFGLALTIVQISFKFQAGQLMNLRDLAVGKKTSGLKHKSFQKLSFSGGLIIPDLYSTMKSKDTEVLLDSARLGWVKQMSFKCCRIKVLSCQ